MILLSISLGKNFVKERFHRKKLRAGCDGEGRSSIFYEQGRPAAIFSGWRAPGVEFFGPHARLASHKVRKLDTGFGHCLLDCGQLGSIARNEAVSFFKSADRARPHPTFLRKALDRPVENCSSSTNLTSCETAFAHRELPSRFRKVYRDTAPLLNFSKRAQDGNSS